MRISGRIENGGVLGLGPEPDTAFGHQLDHLILRCRAAGLETAPPEPPTDHHAAFGAIRLHYLDWGDPGTGRPGIVFLHGGGLTAHSWDVVCCALRDRNHCLALDQRGHGDSEWSLETDYSFAAYGRDIDRFLAAHGGREQILVGLSLGGLNGLAYAADHPELRSMVTVDAGPRLRDAGTRRIRSRMATGASFPSLQAMVDQVRGDRRPTDPRLLELSVAENARRLADGRWAWKYDPRIKTDERPAAQTAREGLIERVPRIVCPTLVVRGARSDVFDEAAAAELVELLPDGRGTVIADSGHNVHRDNPVALAAAIASFLDEIGA